MPDQEIERQLQEFVENEENVKQTAPIQKPVTEITAQPMPWHRSNEQISASNQIGWQKIKLQDLPTKGYFYPEDTEIVIRSASAQEIRHWSTLQEDDLSTLDDMLNYVLERCVGFKTPTGFSSWKDIKEIDRFYILLAVREYTFVKGENHLQVKVSETNTLNVTKDMIDFMNFDERLMKYYDAQKRCFVLKFKSGNVIEVSIPSVGVTNFLKTYIQRKQNQGHNFDMDFISFAPFICKDWRGLTDAGYEQIVLNSNSWSIAEISVLTHLKDLFVETVSPVVKYVDEGGTERKAPLNFQGGIKSVFLISDPFGELV